MNSDKCTDSDLIGRAADPAFWAEVRINPAFEKHLKVLNTIWRNYCETDSIPALSYSKFKLFWTTGDRSQYERDYFARRKALGACSLLAVIYPEEDKYLIKLMDVIFAICDEYTWCLPAHQTDPNVNNNVHLDLFACETGFALSEIYCLMGGRLDNVIRDRIRVEIDRRIINPFIDGSPFTKNHRYLWEDVTSNWAAVCAGSTACTFMLMRSELFDTQLEAFELCMRHYLSGFGADGICTEGCAYWNYGFSFFVVYADMLRRFTKGAFDHFKDPKVRAVATYMQKVRLSGGTCVSFSDAGQKFTYPIGIIHYLKHEYPDEVRVPDPKYAFFDDGCARFCTHLRSYTWLDTGLMLPDDEPEFSEYYEKDSEIYIRKTPRYGFAAKGGNNSEPHNQNDVGTFIFAKGGRQLICDLGAGPYSRQYFSSQRYTDHIECSALGHNLPTFGGVCEREGGSMRARDVKYADNVFSMDIAGAFPTEELRSCERRFELTEEGVKIIDRFDFTGSGPVTERLITQYEPVVDGGCVYIDRDSVDGGCAVRFDGSAVGKVHVETAERDGRRICYIVIFELKPGAKEFIQVIMDRMEV
ncbi:MAG: hypothetical protein J5950_03370 [Clostridia bacterium]|nr:hypothetical protein [Clostridia bacterium]